MKYIKTTFRFIKKHGTFKNFKRAVTVTLFVYIVGSFTFTTLTITDKLGYTNIKTAESELTCPESIDDYINMKVEQNMAHSAVQKQIRSEIEYQLWQTLQTRAEVAKSVLR